MRPYSRALAVACVSASVLAAFYWGQPGRYAFFPAMAAAFFLVRAGEALVVSLAGLAAQTWLARTLEGWSAQTLAFVAASLLMCMFIHAFSRRLRTDIKRLHADSTQDPLTGAGNRRLLDDALAAAQVDSAPVTMLMIDVDHFKSVNDRFGHAAGDLCLQRLAQRLQEALATGQSLYRYGGEEFVVLTPGGGSEGYTLAERLRQSVAALALIRETRVTVSIGVAEHRPGESARDWIRRVDNALYSAKGAGRDRVLLAD